MAPRQFAAPLGREGECEKFNDSGRVDDRDTPPPPVTAVLRVRLRRWS